MLIKLNSTQRSIIIGSLLGDANCTGSSPSSNKLQQFAQSSKEFLFFTYSFFSEFCKEPYFVKPSAKSIARPGFENSKGIWAFYTPTNPVWLLWSYELFYGPISPKGKRRTPEEARQLKEYLKEAKAKGISRVEAQGYNYKKHVPSNIYEQLDPISLAFWIMGDGSWRGHGVLQATHSFNQEDVKLLIHTLDTKFGLNCTIQTVESGRQTKKIGERHNLIYITANSVYELRKQVKPHTPQFMQYKQGQEDSKDLS